MGVLLTVKDLTKSFDSRPLFKDLNFVVETGERIGLIGPNGAGKSTLLKIVAGHLPTDDGELVFQRGTRVGYLEQQPVFTPGANIQDTLLEVCKDPHDWENHVKVDELYWKLGFERVGITLETVVDSLSGGWKKRVALARELMKDPDLLLMDEPTNHLDVEGILWLEELIARAPFATLTITHDRLFLERIASRIIELDRRHVGGILSVKGAYSTYLTVREALITNQENREVILRGNLRRETEWLRAGAKARTTKQQARITRHGELSDEVSELATRNIDRRAQMEFQAAENNPKRLIEVKKLSKSFSKDKPLFNNFDLLLTPGSRIGILGENGCGKSTLIRVLLGLEGADSGKQYRSDQLKVCYFEQNRAALDPSTSLLRTICPHGDNVTYQGRQIHIRSYLDRFLFKQEQMDLPIRALSGGEQSRVLIAKLMLNEANLLVLDEPTNDLDIATLNVLQDCLTEFDGAVLLVSHDRYFLDQVSTEILAFPINEVDRRAGKLTMFADIAQWEKWHKENMREAEKVGTTKASAVAAPPKTTPATNPNTKKELESLTKKIARLEQMYSQFEAECLRPENSKDLKKLTDLGEKMKATQSQIDELYKQWQGLEKSSG